MIFRAKIYVQNCELYLARRFDRHSDSKQNKYGPFLKISKLTPDKIWHKNEWFCALWYCGLKEAKKWAKMSAVAWDSIKQKANQVWKCPKDSGSLFLVLLQTEKIHTEGFSREKKKTFQSVFLSFYLPRISHVNNRVTQNYY